METTPERLAEDHWDWMAGLLRTLPGVELNVDTLEYIYVTAFIHGYKHGEESKDNGR